MKNLAGLMKQASEMQKKMEDMQARLETLTQDGSAGAGMVSLTLNGKGELRSLRVDPKLADPAEMEMLQDLIVAAHADAKRKVEAMAAEEMQKVTGGLNLPGGMKLSLDGRDAGGQTGAKQVGGPELERLIGLLGKLPGLGPRSARRAALRLLQQPETRMLPLAAALGEAARTVRSCSLCGNLDSRDPCTVCADPHRDRGVICVVEGVGDLWALERAHVHRGLYHVLGGTLSALAGLGPEDLNVAPLLARVREGEVTEVILALGATVDGATTTHWLTEKLKPLGVTVSRVGQGVPMGGALDVLDDGTLAAALRARRAF